MVAIRSRSRQKGTPLPNVVRSHLLIVLIIIVFVGVYFAYLVLDRKQVTTKIAASITSKAILFDDKPYIIYGTAWKKDNTARLVQEAIETGFRFVDTACQPKHYNEAGVGEGWVAAALNIGLKREDLFLQTKFTSVNGQDPKNIPYDKDTFLENQVKQSVEKSLENLQTSYLDRVLLHSPMKTFEETLRVWRVLENFVMEEKVKNLGISNCYDLDMFQKLYKEAYIKPSALQNRFHEKTGFDVELREFCNEMKIEYQSFWTLTANRQALKSAEVESFAKDRNLTPQTLMYAFMMQMGHIPLSGTKNKKHMIEDVEVMNRIHSGERILTPDDMKMMRKALGIEEKNEIII